MHNKYTQSIANHYAAYRPPLHNLLLANLKLSDSEYAAGLDIGCGTGYSTIALAKYCTHVYGIDPSSSMLASATPWLNVSYFEGSGEHIPISECSVNIVTLAGSLNYIVIPALTKELKRVCSENAEIILYDFEVLIRKQLDKLDIEIENPSNSYDHTANLSGNDSFTGIKTGHEIIDISLTSSELSHILLSDMYRYQLLSSKYEMEDPFSSLVHDLDLAAVDKKHILEVGTYFSKYRLAE